MTSPIWRQTLGDLLRRSARRWPDKLAVSCGETSWSYAQFDAVCDRFAAGLATQGVSIGSRVAIVARNSHAFAALRFSLARIGAVLVPINFMLQSHEIAYVLKHSDAQWLCADAEFFELAREAACDTNIKQLLWLPSEHPTRAPADAMTFDSLSSERTTFADPDLDGRMLAQINYTSGTESAPKGAMLTHESVIWQYVSCLVDAEISYDDTLLHAMPLFHCAQLDAFFGPAIYVGATNVITSKPTPDNLLPLLARHRINSFFAPPTIWISLLRSAQFDSSDLSHLRKGYYGASIMPVEVLLELQRRLPNVRLWNLYGQTEIAPVATVLRPDEQLRKAGSAGRAVLNVETRVVDEEGNLVRPGEIGEIVHRSPQLIQGYFQDEARTRGAFAGGWFHSGDLATIDAEGYITIVDRKKDMIKTGGENVSSREVEEVIYALEQVAEVAVVGLPHPKWIEAVTAVIVLKQGHALTEDRVVAHCTGKLARFKVPKRALFVAQLPKNPSGKVLKRELRRLHQDTRFE